MSPTLTTFLFEAANFLVLAAVLGWLFFKPVRQTLSDYRTKLDALARAADEKMAAAEQTRADVESQRRAFRDELTKSRNETLEAARQEAENIITQAREQATRLKQAAEQHVTHLDESQMATLSRAVAFAAGRVVGQLLTQLEGSDLHAGLLRAACDQVRALALNSTPVTVESSQALSDDDRAQLDAALGSAAAGATYRVVADLGGGVRVTTTRGLVDASIAGLAEFGQRALAAELENHAPAGAANGT